MTHTDKIWYGGDYNPDQWEESIWDMDFELFQQAHVNMITLPVFSWAQIEKSPGNYDLEWLVKVLDRAKKHNIAVCFATSTAVQPAWLSQKHPEILPTDAYGIKKRFGGRVKYCPNSQVFKAYAARLVRKLCDLAQRYDNIVMWHIGNEYDNYCYCDNCRAAFQKWVRDKYGTIEAVNDVWYLRFWGHTLYSFEDIEIPDFRTENWEMGGITRTNFQTIHLDYMRFMNDAILSCYLNERSVIKALTPHIPVTTNFMGAFKPINYFKWAPHLDVISWDHYPGLNEPPYKGAMLHDLMRSLKKGTPFWLMEQSPSQQNWAPFNTLKRPGQLRLQSYQTLARGADAILYFQLRRSLANCEKFHGALIDHHGGNQTRVFKECQVIGQELKGLSEIIGGQVVANVGIVFDWENWWAIEMSSGPSIHLHYREHVELYYKALYQQHLTVDFLNDLDDFHTYPVIFAPMLYMVKEEMYQKLKRYVEQGGKLVLTTFSGIVNENDHVTTKGYPGLLREMAGIWVEEIDGLMPDMENGIVGFDGKDYKCKILCDIISIDSAECLASYDKDFYKGKPVITKNQYGEGCVYYIGTIPEDAFVDAFVQHLFPQSKEPRHIEVTKRVHQDREYTFYLNHGTEAQRLVFDTEKRDILTGELASEMTINGFDVRIVK